MSSPVLAIDRELVVAEHVEQPASQLGTAGSAREQDYQDPCELLGKPCEPDPGVLDLVALVDRDQQGRRAARGSAPSRGRRSRRRAGRGSARTSSPPPPSPCGRHRRSRRPRRSPRPDRKAGSRSRCGEPTRPSRRAAPSPAPAGPRIPARRRACGSPGRRSRRRAGPSRPRGSSRAGGVAQVVEVLRLGAEGDRQHHRPACSAASSLSSPRRCVVRAGRSRLLAQLGGRLLRALSLREPITIGVPASAQRSARPKPSAPVPPITATVSARPREFFATCHGAEG